MTTDPTTIYEQHIAARRYAEETKRLAVDALRKGGYALVIDHKGLSSVHHIKRARTVMLKRGPAPRFYQEARWTTGRLETLQLAYGDQIHVISEEQFEQYTACMHANRAATDPIEEKIKDLEQDLRVEQTVGRSRLRRLADSFLGLELQRVYGQDEESE